VIDQFSYDAPKTAQLAGLVERLGYADKKVLILTSGVKENVFLSGRNLPSVHVMPYADVTTYHILWSDVVLIESEALGEKLDAVAESAEVSAAVKQQSARAEAKPAKSAPKAAKKSAPKAEAKARTSAKKAPAKPKAKAASNKKASSAKAKPSKKKGGKK
jgi:hypothetical protein